MGLYEIRKKLCWCFLEQGMRQLITPFLLKDDMQRMNEIRHIGEKGSEKDCSSLHRPQMMMTTMMTMMSSHVYQACKSAGFC